MPIEMMKTYCVKIGLYLERLVLYHHTFGAILSYDLDANENTAACTNWTACRCRRQCALMVSACFLVRCIVGYILSIAHPTHRNLLSSKNRKVTAICIQEILIL